MSVIFGGKNTDKVAIQIESETHYNNFIVSFTSKEDSDEKFILEPQIVDGKEYLFVDEIPNKCLSFEIDLEYSMKEDGVFKTRINDVTYYDVSSN